MTESQAAEALSGALSRVLVGGENRGTQSRGCYLALCAGGQAVTEELFDFLRVTPFRFSGGAAVGTAPTDPAALAKWNERQAKSLELRGLARNARSFAALVDAIPSTVGDWSPTGSSLDTFYDQWLSTIELPNPKLDAATVVTYAKARKDLGFADEADNKAMDDIEAKASEVDLLAMNEADILKQMALQDAAVKLRDKVQAILDKPKTIYGAYAERRNAYQSAVTALNLQLDTDPSDDFRIRTLRDAMRNALDDWQVLGNKVRYETAVAIMARVDGVDLNKAVENLKKRYQAVRELNTTGDGSPDFVPVGLVPSNFLEDRGAWTTLTFDSQTVVDTTAFDHLTTSSAAGGCLFWSSGSESRDTSASDVRSSSEKLKVTFDFARVAVDRSTWFDTNLLTSRMWKWGVEGDGQLLSDGNLPPQERCALPMYVTDVIFVRNAKVSMAMSQSQYTTFHEEMSKSSSSGFWVFGSSSSETRTTDRSSYEFTSGTATVTIPGLRIAGYLCDRLPKLPNPDF